MDEITQSHRWQAPRGTRRFGGRHYILAGRGTREEMATEAKALRASWQYVRVRCYRGPASLDDFACYVFGLISA